MKIKIILMLAILMIGMAGATSYQGATTFDENISYIDSTNTINTFDFYSPPSGGDSFVFSGSFWSLVNARYISQKIVVGPESDPYSFLYTFKTDGVDDCVQIQQAIDVGKGDVLIKIGQYNLTNQVKFRSNNSNVHIVGEGNAFSHSQLDAEKNSEQYVSMWMFPSEVIRATFNIYNTTDAAFYIPSGSAGLTIENVAFYYPEQNPDAVVEYPPTIEGADWYVSDVIIRDCFAINPYRFIYFPRLDKSQIYNIRGQPIYEGIRIDQSCDWITLRNIHFSPGFWNTEMYGNDTRKFRYNNGAALHIGRADWPMITNVVAFGYKHGIYTNTTNNANIVGCGFDVCKYPVYILDGFGNIITGSQFAQYSAAISDDTPHPTDGAAIEFVGGSYNIVLGNVIRYSNTSIINSGASLIAEHNQEIDLTP